MSQAKLISFDVDGTLLQTGERQLEWFKYWAKISCVDTKTLDNFDVGTFLDFYNPLCKMDVQLVYDALGLPCDMKNRLHPVWHAFEDFNVLHPVEPYDGIVDAIDSLDAQNYTLALLTTNSLPAIKSSLQSCGLMTKFKYVITEANKSNGRAMIELARMAGTTDVCHFGDTLSDLIVAKSDINVRAIGVSWGYEGRDILAKGVDINGRRVHFDRIIDAPEEIVSAI